MTKVTKSIPHCFIRGQQRETLVCRRAQCCLVPVILYIWGSFCTFDPPVFGDLQLCDVSLNECHVAVVTIVLSVFLHKALHKIHSRHVFGFGQQVAGVATAETHVYKTHRLWIINAPWLKKQNKTKTKTKHGYDCTAFWSSWLCTKLTLIPKCWLFSFLHSQSVQSVFEQTSDSPDIPPNASSQLQYTGFAQAGQNGEDLGQLVLR